MEDFMMDGRTWLGMMPDTQAKVLKSLVVVLFFLLVRSAVMRIMLRNVTDVRQRYSWSRGVTSTIAILIVIFLGVIWFAGLERIATFAGILGAGLAVALHDTIANIAGFLFIMLRRPFEVGDRIEIGGVAGDVIDIRLFQFSLLEIGNWVDADQSTGRILQVPNGQVLRSVTASFNKGFDYIWHEIPILITFESNWKKAKGILQDIVDDDRFVVAEEVERQVRRAASRYLIYSGKVTPIVYTTVRDSGVLLTVRYMTKPKTRRGTEQQLWEQILERFAENDDIELAYPTVRYYDQSQ
ncbi:MAG: mechanosensitive ion channel family protein [Deltaproteobacteria bacterium]|nr:mechanosensitive ion channel family protein [Deltaproteobacteria bacterium]MBW2550790.1 mechanosensitive ion channel family protein [Deltaproteobacteria bacterium]MBW2626400.1 mechanosensitive ion channel family protein [Deltaproteobacteria bacterium]